MKPIYLRRCLLLSLVAMSGCAVIWPEEQGPTAEILKSRYVTQEQREAVAALNSGALGAAIEAAREK